MNWYLRACPVCGGDLHDDLQDPGWVTCFMCARSFEASDLFGTRGHWPRALTRTAWPRDSRLTEAHGVGSKRADEAEAA